MIKSLTEIHQAALFDINEKIAETHELLLQEKEFQRTHEELMERRLENAIRIGQNLLDFKTTLPHGKFMTFVQVEFGMSQDRAQDYMLLARKGNTVTSRYLSPDAHIELASPSMPPVVVEMVETKQIPPTVAAIREAKREVKEQVREQRREGNRQEIAKAKTIEETLGTAKFATIVIDPPWDWSDEGDIDQFGRARPTYGTMTIEQLLELPVSRYADNDCHLYLWITNRSLPKGFRLLDAWGFRYVTCVTWVKPSFGMGNYFRGQTEHILFGVKGSQLLKRKDAPTYFEAPRGPNGHSSKPIESYSFIESCSPGPYLEMFARSQRTDWTSWGAEV